MQQGKTMTIGVALVLAGLPWLTSCTGVQKGAVVGGVAGAATGAAVGGGKGAVIGGVVGTAAGAIIGDYMAKQKEELEKVPGADVEKVGDELVVTFQSPILFDTDSSVLKPEARQLLDEVGEVLMNYPDTDVLIKGHTDDTGSEEHNQQLSDRRAGSVRNYLVTRGVTSARLKSLGFGESLPVASNGSASGRTQNRRVELQIAANEELRQRSEDAASQQR